MNVIGYRVPRDLIGPLHAGLCTSVLNLNYPTHLLDDLRLRETLPDLILLLLDGVEPELVKELRLKYARRSLLFTFWWDYYPTEASVKMLNDGADFLPSEPLRNMGDRAAEYVKVAVDTTLRRRNNLPFGEIHFARGVSIDLTKGWVLNAGRLLWPPCNLWKILRLLVLRYGSIVPDVDLRGALYGEGSLGYAQRDPHAIWTDIHRLRKLLATPDDPKFGRTCIEKVGWQGYRWALPLSEVTR